MNCQLCKVLTIFLITLNTLDSARGFKGNRFVNLNQEKGIVDIFGGEYDHQEDQEKDQDSNVEIDLHEKPNENEKISNAFARKISLFRGNARKKVKTVDTFYDEFHGSEVSDDPVVIAITFYSNVLAPFTHFFYRYFSYSLIS